MVGYILTTGRSRPVLVMSVSTLTKLKRKISRREIRLLGSVFHVQMALAILTMALKKATRLLTGFTPHPLVLQVHQSPAFRHHQARIGRRGAFYLLEALAAFHQRLPALQSQHPPSSLGLRQNQESPCQSPNDLPSPPERPAPPPLRQINRSASLLKDLQHPQLR